MIIYKCICIYALLTTYCSLAAGREGLLTRLFIEKIMSSVDYKPVSFLQIVTD